MSARDCALKMAALTPPPWRQRIRGREVVSGFVEGSLDADCENAEDMVTSSGVNLSSIASVGLAGTDQFVVCMMFDCEG